MSDHNGFEIEKLKEHKERLLKQSEIDRINASLAKLKGDHAAVKQHLESSNLNKQKADKKQERIDFLLTSTEIVEEYSYDEIVSGVDDQEESCEQDDQEESCEQNDQEESCEQNDQEESCEQDDQEESCEQDDQEESCEQDDQEESDEEQEYADNFYESIREHYLEPVQTAIEMLENGETSKELKNIELKDLQLVESVLQLLFSGDKTIFQAIRAAKFPTQETDEEEIYEDSDEVFDENEEDNENLDSEIENEIYDEIENELGYDFEKEIEDEENLD